MTEVANTEQSYSANVSVDQLIADIYAVLVENRAGPLTRVVVTRDISRAWYEQVGEGIRTVLESRRS